MRLKGVGQGERRHEDETDRGPGAKTRCREQVRAGRLPPHFHARLVKEIESQAATYTDQGGLSFSFQWFRDFVREAGPLLPQGELGHHPQESDAREFSGENPSQTLARLASTRMVEMSLSYGQAAEYVLKTNPALATAYREYTLNPTTGE